MMSKGKFFSSSIKAFVAVLLINFASSSVSHAETVDLPGTYRLPPVGTNFQFDNLSVLVKSINKLSFNYLAKTSEKSADKIWSSLFTQIITGGGKIVDHEEKHQKFWPLKIGNKIEYEYYTGTSSYPRYVDMEVTAKEKITVPAGEFFTYRITRNTTISNVFAADSTSWYSPKLGIMIKYCPSSYKLEQSAA